MNVQTRKQFEQALADIAQAELMVVDTETNGLRYYRNNYIISISVYIPEIDTSYNLPFRHGQGEVEVAYNDSNPEGTPFEKMNWAGKAKKQIFLDYWFKQYAKITDFGNLPEEWMDELKAVWGRCPLIFHNARFDLHMLEAEYFPRPPSVEDTMIGLHLVCEDWYGVQVEAPFTWTVTDHRKGLCNYRQIGQWARMAGQLIIRPQSGNRQLKWQAALHRFDNATCGEERLAEAVERFEKTLIDFIIQHPDDPYNANLERQADYEKKVVLDRKANMWMLPSGDVAEYAELDVVLTWKLRQWTLNVLRQWDNLKLYETQNAVLYEVAWRMERNGVKLNVRHTQEELAKLQPQIVELEELVTGGKFKLGSYAKLRDFLNSGVLEQAWKRGWPEWWPEDRRNYTETYTSAGLADTSKAILEQYDGHPVVQLILEYRRMKKSADTYLVNWLKAADESQIVRGQMNPDGTVSGRFSSSGEAGNWQNIPDRGGYTIKRAIVPYDKEWVFFAIDYGQLEARLAAWIAEVELGYGNREMTRLFEEGVDMHTYTRDMVGIRDVVYPGMSTYQTLIKLGYPAETANPEGVVATHCRYIAKTMNFGLLYSGTEYMLSKLLKIDLDSACVLVWKWREIFPAFSQAQEHYERESMVRRLCPGGKGYAMYSTQPISGRHRKLHKYATWMWYYENGIRKGFNPQEAAARKVWNNIVQGLGGYICTVSALNINQKYNDNQLRIFANIHDALDGYVHRDHIHIVADLMDIMIDWDVWPRLTVDLEGSQDGTWQGMRAVKDFERWCWSEGGEGYTEAPCQSGII